MTSLSNILRGGQVQIHQFRMARQILGVAATIALFIGIIVFSYEYSKYNEKFDYNAITTYSKSWVITKIVPVKYAINMKVSYGDSKIEDTPYSFLASPILEYRTIFYFKKLQAFTIQGLAISFFSFILIMIVWMKLGNLKDKSSNQKGVYSPDEVKKYLKKNNMLSELNLGTLPLVKNKETSHILLAGASGTGKTNCILTLAKQIRQQQHNAIIVDLTGHYVDLFYNAETDFILNPQDKRATYWDLWQEANCKEKLSIISDALFAGDHQSHDKFWSESAKTIFEDVVMYLKKENKANYKALFKMLAVDDLKVLRDALKNSASASLIDPKNDKTAFSIRSVVATYSKSLNYLADMKVNKDKFSIEDWMNNIDNKHKGSWLFFSASPKQRKVMEPLVRMWMDIALASLMNLPSSFSRRVWFIMDEMPVLGKLPSLSSMLSEARKYGGCIVSGIQSMSQVYEAYGHHGANIIIDGFAAKIFFRVTGTENTTKIARIFGQEEQEEINENITYGAHEMRDGVSISRHQKNKLIVTEKDIIKLKDLEAYALLPCELDIVKVRFELFK